MSPKCNSQSKIKIKDYGVSDNMAWELGLALWGTIKNFNSTIRD